jgi:Chondroitin N-acetylgalactosaminyltransferase
MKLLIICCQTALSDQKISVLEVNGKVKHFGTADLSSIKYHYRCCCLQMTELMYHNFDEPRGSFKNLIPKQEITKAITLHPVKEVSYQYRLHQHMLGLEYVRLRRQLTRLRRQINVMDALLQVCILGHFK